MLLLIISLQSKGVSIEELVSWWVCLGCDRNFVFQGHQTRLTSQLRSHIAPFLFINVHYITYITNLVVVVLSKLLLVFHMEFMLQSLYSFLAYNLKKLLEFTNLAKTLETKRQKLLRNVKTHWISMLSPLKRTLTTQIFGCEDAF
jgi:hypothetical protein